MATYRGIHSRDIEKPFEDSSLINLSDIKFKLAVMIAKSQRVPVVQYIINVIYGNYMKPLLFKTPMKCGRGLLKIKSKESEDKDFYSFSIQEQDDTTKHTAVEKNVMNFFDITYTAAVNKINEIKQNRDIDNMMWGILRKGPQIISIKKFFNEVESDQISDSYSVKRGYCKVDYMTKVYLVKDINSTDVRHEVPFDMIGKISNRRSEYYAVIQFRDIYCKDPAVITLRYNVVQLYLCLQEEMNEIGYYHGETKVLTQDTINEYIFGNNKPKEDDEDNCDEMKLLQIDDNEYDEEAKYKLRNKI